MQQHYKQHYNKQKYDWMHLAAIRIWREELERQMQEFLQKKRHQLEMYAAKLDGCSPLKKLQGSYAFLSRTDGRPIQSVTQVQVDDTIQAQLLDGKITAIVCRTEENGVV